MSDPKPRVLCVDDERNVLDGVKRHLRKLFDVHLAERGAAGLLELEKGESFAVVVSDLRMPEMDGIEFLTKVRECAPETTRVLLTGNADLSAAMAAVNDGNIFRFLAKPCPPATLIAAVEAAAEQHELVIAERVLLEQTLHGSVKMLTEILAMANPKAFGRANRIKQRAGKAADRLGAPARWKMEMAAMLSQAACITLPPETLDRLYSGEDLNASEQPMVDRLPSVAEALLVGIPRIEEVRAILRHQNDPWGGASTSEDEIPVGARILRAVLDFDVLESSGVPEDAALEALRGRRGAYDPDVLQALGGLEESEDFTEEILDVPIGGLRSGMVLVDPVETVDGRLLVAHGHEVSVGLLERLQNFSEHMEVKEPLRVLVRTSVARDGKGV